MLILLDENVDNRLKDVLDSAGFDVKTTFEENLSGSKDREILEYAENEEMVILTHDDDFLSISSEMNEYASIMYIPQKTGFKEMKDRVKTIKNSEIKKTGDIYFL